MKSKKRLIFRPKNYNFEKFGKIIKIYCQNFKIFLTLCIIKLFPLIIFKLLNEMMMCNYLTIICSVICTNIQCKFTCN